MSGACVACGCAYEECECKEERAAEPRLLDLEHYARISFEAYADRMATATTLRIKTPIAEWDSQHEEVRASWRVATMTVLREYQKRIDRRSEDATRPVKVPSTTPPPEFHDSEPDDSDSQ